MASPFSVFRKNQKKMLAVLTILTVFSFTFGYIVLDMIGSRGGGAAFQKAFTSKYGSLNERELSGLRERHNTVISVLGGILVRMNVPQQRAQWYLEGIFGGSSNEEVAISWLLARKAEELGMIADNQAINKYLERLTENKLTAQQLAETFNQVGVSPRIFFELMRDELLALKLKESFAPSLQAVTPGQRWDYFCRVFKKASIEAVPVPVESYFAKIEDPGDEVLKPFFMQYREELPKPDSPKPGFKKPQRVAIEYFKADMEKFTSPEAVSEDEVMEYYEKNKDYLKQAYPPFTPEKPAEETDKKTGEDAKTELPGLEGAADKKPAETPPAETKTPPVETKTPELNPPKTEPQKKSEEAEQPKTSATPGRSPFILASFQQQPEPEDGKLPESSEEPAVGAEQPKPADESAEKPADKPAEPAAEQPPKAGEKPAEPAETKMPILGTAEQLKKLIRRQIAMEKIGEIFEKISDDLIQYRDLKNDYDYSSPAEREGKTPPQKPDYEEIARKHGLTIGSTGMVDKMQAAETEIGSVLTKGNISATQAAFQAMGKLRPEAGSDTLREHIYLFWKTDEEKEETPKFKDEGMRDQVLREWKKIEARKLALAEAEKLAKEAGEADKPLAEVFADMSKWYVVTPPDFSWMKIDNVSMSYNPRPVISAVDGVEIAGPEFMKTVFGLEPGKVGSAMNDPQTVAYVIQVKEFTPTYDELWSLFQKTDFRMYGSIWQREFARKSHAWLMDIQNQADFQWTPEHEKLKIRDEQE